MVTCFLPRDATGRIEQTISQLQTSDLVQEIRFIDPQKIIQSFEIKKILADVITPYVLLYVKTGMLLLEQFSVERFVDIAKKTQAGMLYADYYEIKNGQRKEHPLIDYQLGSIRDDFNFGSLLLFRTDAIKEAVDKQTKDYKFAALYHARLFMSQKYDIIRIPEFLYTDVEADSRKFGVKIFDYLDPKNRAKQLEMEYCATEHLRAIGAYLPPVNKTVNLNGIDFQYEASVVIPVKNRECTIAGAINSVLDQQTKFSFNILVVDNYSTDKTTTIVNGFAKKDERIILHIPKSKTLGIGGCWNEAILHPLCGKFAIQLDSDDIYRHAYVLQTIVDKFYETSVAMVIGSYMIVDFNLNELPIGLIDHKEWTDNNGHNNALRINGLGAPRAFYTPIIRNIKFPNVSYAEDYAVSLAITRTYKIARIYESLYFCRRWEDNTDAHFDIAKANHHNIYKDRIRSFEIAIRQQLHAKF